MYGCRLPGRPFPMQPHSRDRFASLNLRALKTLRNLNSVGFINVPKLVTPEAVGGPGGMYIVRSPDSHPLPDVPAETPEGPTDAGDIHWTLAEHYGRPAAPYPHPLMAFLKAGGTQHRGGGFQLNLTETTKY